VSCKWVVINGGDRQKAPLKYSAKEKKKYLRKQRIVNWSPTYLNIYKFDKILPTI